jgi:hypothetical protein
MTVRLSIVTISAVMLAFTAQAQTPVKPPPACVIIPPGAVQTSGEQMPRGHANKFKATFKVNNPKAAWDFMIARLEQRQKKTGRSFSAMGDGSYIIYGCDARYDVVLDMDGASETPGEIVIQIAIKGG